MDVALEKYNVKRVYGIPPGLKDLLTDISREVLREQPTNIYLFIANYLEAMLDARNCCRAATKTVENAIEYGKVLVNVTEMYDVDIPRAHEACTKIQAAYRGYKTRLDLLHKGDILFTATELTDLLTLLG